MVSGIDLLFGLFEGILFTLVSCMIAVKLTNIMTGHTDKDILWGSILFGQSLLIDLAILFTYINLATLELTIYERTFFLFEYLSSSTYCGLVAIISLVFLPIACILLTKSRVD